MCADNLWILPKYTFQYTECGFWDTSIFKSISVYSSYTLVSFRKPLKKSHRPRPKLDNCIRNPSTGVQASPWSVTLGTQILSSCNTLTSPTHAPPPLLATRSAYSRPSLCHAMAAQPHFCREVPLTNVLHRKPTRVLALSIVLRTEYLQVITQKRCWFLCITEHFLHPESLSQPPVSIIKLPY